MSILEDIIVKILAAVIIGILSWLSLTTMKNEQSLQLIEYKLDQNNIILQDLYTSKKDK